MRILVICEDFEKHGIERVTTISPVHSFSPVFTIKFMCYHLFKKYAIYRLILSMKDDQEYVTMKDQLDLNYYGIEDGCIVFINIICPKNEKYHSLNMLEDFIPINDEYVENLVSFIPQSGTRTLEDTEKLLEISEVLDIGMNGPLVEILKFLDSNDLLITMINVSMSFRKIIYFLWDRGLLPQIERDMNKDRLFVLLVLGFIEDHCFMRLCQKHPDLINNDLILDPRRISRLVGHHSVLLQPFYANFNFDLIIVCIMRNYQMSMKYLLEHKSITSIRSIYPSDCGGRCFPHLKTCLQLGRSPSMLNDLIDSKITKQGLSLPPEIYKHLLSTQPKSFFKRLLRILEQHDPLRKGQVLNIRKIILSYIHAVKMRVMQGSLEEWLKIEKHFPNFTLRYALNRRIYYNREDTWPREGDPTEDQEFSYIHSNKKLFRIINYLGFQVFQWDLIKYFLTKEFGTGKFGVRKRFRVSKNNGVFLVEKKDLVEFVCSLDNHQFHNLYSKEILEIKKMNVKYLE